MISSSPVGSSNFLEFPWTLNLAETWLHVLCTCAAPSPLYNQVQFFATHCQVTMSHLTCPCQFVPRIALLIFNPVWKQRNMSPSTGCNFLWPSPGTLENLDESRESDPGEFTHHKFVSLSLSNANCLRHEITQSKLIDLRSCLHP